LEGAQASSFSPGKSDIQMKMSMRHGWNGQNVGFLNVKPDVVKIITGFKRLNTVKNDDKTSWNVPFLGAFAKL